MGATDSKTIPPVMVIRPQLALAGLILVYLAIAGLYATNVPLWNAPDEPAHHNYVRHLSETGTLPVLQMGDYDAALLERLKAARFPAGESIDSIRYESWQPPLYYALCSLVYKATTGIPMDTRALVLRFPSILFGALVLVTAYAIASPIAGAWGGVMAAGFIAFVPMWVFITASINNDSLAVLVVSALLLVLTHMSMSNQLSSIRLPKRYLVGIGLLLGAGAITKSTTYIVLPLVALAILWPRSHLDGGQNTLGQRVKELGLALAVAAAVGGWWFVRNAIVYGNMDIMGRLRHDQVVVGQPTAGPFSLELVRSLGETVFRSFWAQFGWMGVLVDQRIYTGLAAICLLTAAGLAVWVLKAGRRQIPVTPEQGRALGILVFSALLTAAVLVYYNLSFIQAQGRYLFPAMAPLAVLFVLSWQALLPPRARPVAASLWLATMVALDVICLYRFILPDLRP